MKSVGLDPRDAQRYPHEFSGGQRQRIAIARALAVEPDMIIADEPLSALDVSIQSQVLNLMKDLQEARGLAFLFITHDLAVVDTFADDVAVMYLGRLVELAPREKLFAGARHPYTRTLMTAVPVPGRGKRKPGTTPTGEVPSPVTPPPGCPFHPRCPRALPVCRAEVPALTGAGTGRFVACHNPEPEPPPGTTGDAR
jgi:oligopeptide/dipeptide ABC transporter ATP-binding protein